MVQQQLELRIAEGKSKYFANHERLRTKKDLITQDLVETTPFFSGVPMITITAKI